MHATGTFLNLVNGAHVDEWNLQLAGQGSAKNCAQDRLKDHEGLAATLSWMHIQIPCFESLVDYPSL